MSAVLANARVIAGQKEIPVFARLLQVLLSLNAKKQGSGELVEIMHQPRNELFHDKAREFIIREAGPLLASLVEEAVQDGLCDCRYPGETVEMVMTYILVTFDDRNRTKESREQEEQKIKAFIFNIERLFGTAPGAFDFIWSLF